MRAVVINRADRPDRLAAFTARARAAGLEFDVHPAPEPQAPDGWGASSQAWSCRQAHLEILTDVTEPTLVFEDDCALDPGFLDRLGAGIQAMPPGWQMLVVGAGFVAYDWEPGSWRPPVHRIGNFYLSHGYLIHPCGRDVAVHATARATTHFDYWLGAALGSCGNTWLLCPYLHQDAELGSDIPD